jgi:hypothetical protein
MGHPLRWVIWSCTFHPPGALCAWYIPPTSRQKKARYGAPALVGDLELHVSYPVGSLRLVHPTHISPKEGEISGTRFGG